MIYRKLGIVHMTNGFKWHTGFTLAEVLITLGIIGIVAAMTIPTLINKTINKELETGFKKNYSMIQNAYKKAYYDNGNTPPNFDDKAAVDEFFTNFRIGSGTKPPGYFVKWYDKSLNTENELGIMFPFANGSYRTCYVLVDGSFIGIYSYDGGAGAGDLIVDTNGVKGPNRVGYDVFIYTNKIVGYENILMPAGLYWMNPPDYLDPRWCVPISKGGVGDGAFCTYYAVQNKCPWDETKTYWESLP